MKETENRTSSNLQKPPKSPLIRGTWRSSILFPSRGGGTFCEAKGGGAFGRETQRKAFTLVELIIVITILAILATIAFMSFQWYTSKSRDANRASTAKNIETWLSLFQVRAGVYPIQSTWGTISVWGTGVTVQWNLDESIARVINLNEVPRDPKTGEMYHYISDTKGRGWKVLYYLENTPDYAFLAQSYAENETRIPVVKGQWPWVLLDTDLNMVTESVDLFGATGSVKSFTILVNDTTKVTGSGLELWGGFQMFAEKWGRLDAPKTCPTGFIAVPWNAEFMQPWFCVAKYEMKQTTGSDTYCTSWAPCWDGDWIIEQSDFPLWNIIVSQAIWTSIRYIKQESAIQACINIWGHLITNNEYMTIARDVENVNENWSWKSVWSGFLYNGNVVWNDYWIPAWDDESEWAKITWTVSTDNRRVLKLSNGENIWDLAGNVWEHVNKANTENWIKFNQWQTTLSWSFNGVWRDNDGIYDFSDMKKYGSSLWLWISQGMGNLRYANGVANNIFLRGSRADNAANTGVFTMYLLRTSSNRDHSVGFRCAF